MWHSMGLMDVFVVYESPSDYPGEIVVRRFTAEGGQPAPQKLVYRGTSLEDARETILKLVPHALRFARELSDERQIFECWI